MSNPALYLNPKLYDKDIESDTNRGGFGRGLAEAARRNDKVVGLAADLTDSTKMSIFAEEFPERFVQIGIAEQNLATVASGLAAMGKIPFAASYAAFSPGRNWEQIKTTAALNDQPVKIMGAHAGLYTGMDGATHQMLEDFAIMRVIPNMCVFAPADAIEAEKVALAMAEDPRPNYVRLTREPLATITTEKTPFKIDRAYIYSPGKDLTLVSTGAMTYFSLLAAEALYKDGIDVEVIHMPVIKPMDTITLLHSIEKTGAVMSVEEHQIAGGLGSAVAEFIVEHHPVPMRRIGVRDRFGESGDPKDLLKEHGLTPKQIQVQVHKFFNEIGRQ